MDRTLYIEVEIDSHGPLPVPLTDGCTESCNSMLMTTLYVVSLPLGFYWKEQAILYRQIRSRMHIRRTVRMNVLRDLRLMTTRNITKRDRFRSFALASTSTSNTHFQLPASPFILIASWLRSLICIGSSLIGHCMTEVFSMFPSTFGTGTNKRRPLEVKRQTISVKAAPKPPPNELKNADQRQRQPVPVRGVKRKRVALTLAPRPQKRERSRAHSSSQPPVDFGKDGSDGEDGPEVCSRNANRDQELQVDQNRIIRSTAAFEKTPQVECAIIHAAEIPLLDRSTKYEPSFAGLKEGLELQLQYPSALCRER